jgi:hypothetical protein
MRDLDLGDGITVPSQLLRAATSRADGPGRSERQQGGDVYHACLLSKPVQEGGFLVH